MAVAGRVRMSCGLVAALEIGAHDSMAVTRPRVQRKGKQAAARPRANVPKMSHALLSPMISEVQVVSALVPWFFRKLSDGLRGRRGVQWVFARAEGLEALLCSHAGYVSSHVVHKQGG